MKEHETKSMETRGRGKPQGKRAAGATDAALDRLRRASTVVRLRREQLYDRFAERFHHFYAEGKDKTREALDEAMAAARKQLAEAGALSREQGLRFEQFLRRDLERTQEELATVGAQAAERLNPARLGAGALASICAVLHSAGSALDHAARRADDALTYRTGEITSAGTLTCEKCGNQMRFAQTGTVPPCPSCHETTFRKGY